MNENSVEEVQQNQKDVRIIESKANDNESSTDKELIYNIKKILKSLTSSPSATWHYKTILSENAYKTLIKLRNYENSLNCKLDNCLHKVNDIDNYILSSMDKIEIRDIIRKISESKIDDDDDDDDDDDNDSESEEYNPKPSSIDIKTNPYCNSIETLESNEISRFRNTNYPAVISYTNTSSSINSTHSIDSNNCLNVDNNYLKAKHALLFTRSISCVEETTTTKTNLSISGSKATMNLSKRKFSLFNLNYYQSRRVTPLPFKSSSIFSASDELDIHANACYRNHIRRNGISNPYHIPLKEGIRELYEKNLRMSEASLQKRMIRNEMANEYDDESRTENNFMNFIQKLFECFKPKKIENFDSSLSYQF